MNYWTLASDPDRYRVLDEVRSEEEGWWFTAKSKPAVGDRVAIWKCKGSDDVRGVVAFGEGEFLTNQSCIHR